MPRPAAKRPVTPSGTPAKRSKGGTSSRPVRSFEGSSAPRAEIEQALRQLMEQRPGGVVPSAEIVGHFEHRFNGHEALLRQVLRGIAELRPSAKHGGQKCWHLRPAQGGQPSAATKGMESSWKYLLRVGPKGGSDGPGARTVAAIGLPVGGLASHPSGFELRSLDGVPPLPSHERVAEAMRQLATGREAAACHALGRSVELAPSVRAYCAEWLRCWNLQPQPSLSGGSALPEAECREIKAAAADKRRSGSLPGRLVVVSLGDELERSHHDLLDREFDSAAQLHALLPEPLAAYSLTATADSPWVSHAVMQQRLGALDAERASQLLLCTVEWSETAPSAMRVRNRALSQPDIEGEDASDALVWSLLEGPPTGSILPPLVVLAASLKFVNNKPKNETRQTNEKHERRPVALPSAKRSQASNAPLLPPLSSEAIALRHPSSLLAQAIRRSTMLCSPAPILHACQALLDADNPVRGGACQLLWGIVCCLLADSSPYEGDAGCMGILELLACALAAKADPCWVPPKLVQEQIVIAALRAQDRGSQPWVGWLSARSNKVDADRIFEMEQIQASATVDARQGAEIRNGLRCALAAFGGNRDRGKWNKFEGNRYVGAIECYLNPDFQSWHSARSLVSRPVQAEAEMVSSWRDGIVKDPLPGSRLANLDDECKLAAMDPSMLCPELLLLLQASLQHPPADWRKHSLQSLARHVRKLSTEINPRERERMTLARVNEFKSTAGLTAPKQSLVHEGSKTQGKDPQKPDYKSSREAITATGSLSAEEQELVERIAEWQAYLQLQLTQATNTPSLSTAATNTTCETYLRASKGPQPTEADARTAFLLLFAERMQLTIEDKDGQKQAVWAFFGGDESNPLCIQRIGSANGQSLGNGNSGAEAVPSLGYVSHTAEPELVEAAEEAVAAEWAKGRTRQLPLAPPGFQWALNAPPGQEEDAESAAFLEVVHTGTSDGSLNWEFWINGRCIPAFDARCILSPCLLPSREVELDMFSIHLACICQALYCTERPTVHAILGPVDLFTRLAEIAHNIRQENRDEGVVFDWMGIAATSGIVPGPWRDALLTLTTRDSSYVDIGKDLGVARDMTEGVVLRIYCALESLYPTVLQRSGALRFRVRPRGAAYCHLIQCLRLLGRGESTPTHTPLLSLKDSKKRKHKEVDDRLPLPYVITELWPHQRRSCMTVLKGIKEGKRGFADASAVGAGKTLTAITTAVHVAELLDSKCQRRYGILVLLPSPSLLKEWLLEIAKHTKGFHVIEQREDGRLFSITFQKNNPPLDGNSLVISTLDRVREHTFVRQPAWDFVIIDECLAVQNAAAKRCPAAWRQIEVSICGCLMLSATFFRSKFESLFYMIRMLRSPLPRTMEYLSSLIKEHIVCEIPETGRQWQLKLEAVPLGDEKVLKYRAIINSWERERLNTGSADGRKLWTSLEGAVRQLYVESGLMVEAFVTTATKMLHDGRRPLCFANTEEQGSMLRRAMPNARWWHEVVKARERREPLEDLVIIADRYRHSQGINMQAEADAIICRPTPGDQLEQMKGRIDRPGQSSNNLSLVVLMAEHTIEEAEAANIHLAGNFFRQYLAPVARKYHEINYEAALAISTNSKPKKKSVLKRWRALLGESFETGAIDGIANQVGEDRTARLAQRSKKSDASTVEAEAEKAEQQQISVTLADTKEKSAAERRRLHSAALKSSSRQVQEWLHPTPGKRGVKTRKRPALGEFSDHVPPVVITGGTILDAIAHLSKNDTKLANLINRVGAEALSKQFPSSYVLTDASLFDKLLRSITFSQISVSAGSAMLRKLAAQVFVKVTGMNATDRFQVLKGASTDAESVVIDALHRGDYHQIHFTPLMIDALDEKQIANSDAEKCPWGADDTGTLYLKMAQEGRVSAGYSRLKLRYLKAMVKDFTSGKITAAKITDASDREAARLLRSIQGIGDWCTGRVLMDFLGRADIMLYGDLTIRNYLNDLYDIGHATESETLLRSAADFDDTTLNRNLIDDVAAQNGWAPYRTVVCILMYFLQEDNLVLL